MAKRKIYPQKRGAPSNYNMASSSDLNTTSSWLQPSAPPLEFLCNLEDPAEISADFLEGAGVEKAS